MNVIHETTLKSLSHLHVDFRKLEARSLVYYPDSTELVLADVSQSGVEHRLTHAAATAWQNMKKAAKYDQVRLIAISAYRSFEQQFRLIDNHVRSGECVNEVLERIAPPGYSQHHTGRAIDIGTFGCKPAIEEFDSTPAFSWLVENAECFGFHMPYLRNNKHGFVYEPWHWFYPEVGTRGSVNLTFQRQ